MNSTKHYVEDAWASLSSIVKWESGVTNENFSSAQKIDSMINYALKVKRDQISQQAEQFMKEGKRSQYFAEYVYHKLFDSMRLRQPVSGSEVRLNESHSKYSNDVQAIQLENGKYVLAGDTFESRQYDSQTEVPKRVLDLIKLF